MIQRTITALLLTIFAFSFTGCSDDSMESYAEMLETEKEVIAAYLEDYEVSDVIPSDNVFDPDVYYQLEDGVYMKVIYAGDPDVMAVAGDEVAFRYERTNLLDDSFDEGLFGQPLVNPYTFIFRLYDNSEYTTYGTGVEQPLYYLGEGAMVSLVIPSKYGFTQEIQAVTPFVYTVDYPRIYKQ